MITLKYGNLCTSALARLFVQLQATYSFSKNGFDQRQRSGTQQSKTDNTIGYQIPHRMAP